MTNLDIHPYRGQPEPPFPFSGGYSLCDPQLEEWRGALDQFYQDNIEVDLERGVVMLYFKYPYEVDLDRIKNERDLLAWVIHLCGKHWMTPSYLKRFARTVAEVKGLTLGKL
jgi:hypothetical protein